VRVGCQLSGCGNGGGRGEAQGPNSPRAVGDHRPGPRRGRAVALREADARVRGPAGGSEARGEAQLHSDLHRRPGLPGRRLLRLAEDTHAQPGPDGARGAEVHELLRADRLRPVARGPDDRLLPAPRRQAEEPGRRPPLPPHGRDHHRRDSQGRGLRHRLLRQVGPRRAPAERVRRGAPPHEAGLRLLLRDADEQRQRREPAAERQGRGEAGGHGHADSSLHRRGSRLHPEERRNSILRLHPPHDAAHEARGVGRFPREVEARPLRRCDRGDRPQRRAGP
jgi:hypothetical protein